jgi:hypothetical protein
MLLVVGKFYLGLSVRMSSSFPLLWVVVGRVSGGALGERNYPMMDLTLLYFHNFWIRIIADRTFI